MGPRPGTCAGGAAAFERNSMPFQSSAKVTGLEKVTLSRPESRSSVAKAIAGGVASWDGESVGASDGEADGAAVGESFATKRTCSPVSP